MNRKRLIFGLILSLTLLPAALVYGDDPPDRIGLIVVGESGQAQTACIVADQAEPTGYDILLASGLEINASSGSLGVAVCAINKAGCAYPAQPCFCNCSGGRCSYWAYYFREAGDIEWHYSQYGAGNRTIDDGGMELWVWRTAENVNDPLPVLTWDEVCDAVTESESLAGQPVKNSGSPIAIVGYIVFGLAASIVVARIVWRRRRIT
jgi:hypothetical protein